MSRLTVAAEGRISAPAERVYRAIADYHTEHHRFLPPAFSDFRVVEGGEGAGTVASFRMKIGGRSREFQVRIAEPEPGRILTETDVKTGAVTTFTVTPESDARSRVEIHTEWEGASGVGGFFERLFAPKMLKSLYSDELQHLESYLSGVPSS